VWTNQPEGLLTSRAVFGHDEQAWELLIQKSLHGDGQADNLNRGQLEPVAKLHGEDHDDSVRPLRNLSLQETAKFHIKLVEPDVQSMEGDTSSIKKLSGTKSVSSNKSGSSSGGYALRSRSSVVVSNSKVPTSGLF
jgi:hypothetical protein